MIPPQSDRSISAAQIPIKQIIPAFWRLAVFNQRDVIPLLIALLSPELVDRGTVHIIAESESLFVRNRL
jgi:hypothetical protein